MCVCTSIRVHMCVCLTMRGVHARDVSVGVCGDLPFFTSPVTHLCDPSPRLLCACYSEYFILCVCYVFVSGLPYSAHLMDSTSHHGVIGQPTTKFSNRVDVHTQANRDYCS